jgi:hypothetical protein
LISTDQLSLKQCRFFILDEADGLLKGGYEPLINRLHAKIPKMTSDGTRLQVYMFTFLIVFKKSCRALSKIHTGGEEDEIEPPAPRQIVKKQKMQLNPKCASCGLCWNMYCYLSFLPKLFFFRTSRLSDCRNLKWTLAMSRCSIFEIFITTLT